MSISRPEQGRSANCSGGRLGVISWQAQGVWIVSVFKFAEDDRRLHSLENFLSREASESIRLHYRLRLDASAIVSAANDFYDLVPEILINLQRSAHDAKLCEFPRGIKKICFQLLADCAHGGPWVAVASRVQC